MTAGNFPLYLYIFAAIFIFVNRDELFDGYLEYRLRRAVKKAEKDLQKIADAKAMLKEERDRRASQGDTDQPLLDTMETILKEVEDDLLKALQEGTALAEWIVDNEKNDEDENTFEQR